MSEFEGTLKEYINISLDRFDGKSVAQAYFLSHCHKDHMVGLESLKFANILKSSKHIFLHCSQTTFNLLMCDDGYSHLQNYVKVLPLEQPTLIPLCDEETGQQENVTVTLLSAGHCVGSVMFLFEGKHGTVLYTGGKPLNHCDFRLSKGDSKRIDSFHLNGCVKPVKSVYIDTTFCLPKMSSLPSREESRDAIITLIDRWFSRGSNHVISLLCKGMYGYEFILREIALHYKTKIHISQQRMLLYKNLPDMMQHFTTDGSVTKIHACKWEQVKQKHSDLPCGSSVGCHNGTLKVLKIKPTTLWFARQSQPLPDNYIRFCKDKQLWRVVHSMHASMDEICDIVRYLRPHHVYANVKPAGLDSLEVAVERLKDFINRDKESKIFSSSCKQDLSCKKISESSLNDEGLLPHIPIAAKAKPSSAVSAKFVELGLDDEQKLSAPPPKRRRSRNTSGKEQIQESV